MSLRLPEFNSHLTRQRDTNSELEVCAEATHTHTHTHQKHGTLRKGDGCT